MKPLTQEIIWQALSHIPDPEIPVVSLVEMGIIREVLIHSEEKVVITITPTFSGCPALEVMKAEIINHLKILGIKSVQVQTSLSPPWSTNWITDEAREKLKSFGLAPPPRYAGDFATLLLDPVPCPYCESKETTLKNNWGATPCRMIFYCQNCNQPFEQFKPL